ncbi:MAG: hypothetical protein O2816_09635, partial [Planctomycetota bacterium]|nr:hypothetical protein [Planctomycetota bacterium]
MRALVLPLALLAPTFAQEDDRVLDWSELAPLPDPVGRAGVFAGRCGDSLVVIGGANFPEGRDWDGGSKVWHGDAFVLAPDGTWSTHADVLPPRAYGVSLTWSSPAGPALVALGGGDRVAHT